jgi:hypothetical protein
LEAQTGKKVVTPLNAKTGMQIGKGAVRQIEEAQLSEEETEE